MKKNSVRLLVIVGLIALLLCSWYTLISDAQKDDNAYMAELNVARQKVQDGLYAVALDHYALAMAQRDSVELRAEIAEVYRDHAPGSSYEAFCEDILRAFPMEIAGYEHLAAYYRDTQAYDACFDTMETAAKRGLKSENLDAIAAELAYAYDLHRCAAVEVKAYSVGYCEVQFESGVWGYLDSRGNALMSKYYKQTGPFTTSGLSPVLLSSGKFALIDTTGKQISLSPEGLAIEECGALLSGKMAVKYDGKYHYCDSNFAELFGEYDYAGGFYGGAAAVMNGDKWAIIDETGKNITDFVYEDVKMDDKGIAFRNDRALVKSNGAYILIDSKGNRVGNESWEDADAFNGDMIAAVKRNGKWGYVDSNGAVVVDFTYEDAKSFASGMGAVSMDGKWGYISSADFQMKIEPAFAEARDFSTNGTAFVKQGEQWLLLRIYRLT